MADHALHLAAGFADQVSSHRPYLLRFARQRLRDAALVEDVVQETLLAALQGAQRFACKASLRTWLTGILRNRIADHLRRGKRDGPPASALGADIDDDEDRVRGEPVEWRDPQRMLEGRQIVEGLRGCLDTLPPLAARAFGLREIEGRSTEEIARELGVTPAYCAVLLHRARLRLRNCLGSNFN